MQLKTILLYQFGHKESIKQVAQNRGTIGAGLVLVLTAGIAREYDQTYYLAEPIKFLFPLIISIAASCFIFLFISIATTPPPDQLVAGQKSAINYRTFLGLFWMMSPLAWFYAVPVERFMTPVDAARANVSILALVATWRVLLMTRVLSVILGYPAWRMFLLILIPSSMLALGGSVLTGFSLIRFMGGILPPDETVVSEANVFVLVASFFVLLVSSFMILSTPKVTPKPLALSESFRIPYLQLGCVLAVWLSIAVLPQSQLRLNFIAEHLSRAEKYRELLSFLSEHEQHEFAPTRRLPPDEYREFIGVDRIPKVLCEMDGSEAEWVRRIYLQKFALILQENPYWLSHVRSTLQIAECLKRVPEGPAWAREHTILIQNWVINSVEKNDQTESAIKLFHEMGVEIKPESARK